MLSMTAVQLSNWFITALVKRLIVIAVDAIFVCGQYGFHYLRLGEFVTIKDATLFCVLLSVGLCIPIMTCGLYKSIFRYIGRPALLLIFRYLLFMAFCMLLYLQFTVFLVFHALLGSYNRFYYFCSFARPECLLDYYLVTSQTNC